MAQRYVPFTQKKRLELNEIGLGDVFDGFDIDVEDSSSDDVLVYMEAR